MGARARTREETEASYLARTENEFRSGALSRSRIILIHFDTIVFYAGTTQEYLLDGREQ